MPLLPRLDELFALSLHPLEIVLRGSTVFWFLFLLFRFVLRREAGTLGIADLLLLVLIADASQSGMAGDARSLGDSMLLMGTIAAWNWLVDWGSWRSAWLRQLVEPLPLVLVRRGRIVRPNLDRALLTVQELMACLRERGVEKLADVKMARLEGDGQITVIRLTSPPDD